MPNDSPIPPAYDSPPPWQAEKWQQHTQLLLNSYEKWVGRPLIPRLTPESDAQMLFQSPFVVVAHGGEADPLLNYGNQAALELWEMSLSELLGTPSRKTAESVHHSERAELLRRTKRFGFIDDYSGIRISSSGRRFQISRATVWNVVDAVGTYVGQAASFSDWELLP
ncbi:MAG: MEKHLA domain-containing protein [Fuerstiella sp.]|nr:MEKHLA domain-containing protein [Fuerstiella sp.]MCP4854822.1 MEKHLA domain-containing protein [Fuerstiella sp.]